MKESPCKEADNRAFGQEIARLLWNPKVHSCVHDSRQMEPVLSLLNTPEFILKPMLPIPLEMIIRLFDDAVSTAESLASSEL
jgi:hypothetical protein